MFFGLVFNISPTEVIFTNQMLLRHLSQDGNGDTWNEMPINYLSFKEYIAINLHLVLNFRNYRALFSDGLFGKSLRGGGYG